MVVLACGGRWVDHRAVFNGVVFRTGTSCPWRDCPVVTGMWKTVYSRVVAAGLLIAALAKECAAITGTTTAVARASTHHTAMSQHCLCGARVPKSLRDRIHHCHQCGLRADRDMVSAALGAFVTFTDPTDPSTARVDFTSSRHAMVVFGKGLQAALSESTATIPAPSGRGHAAARPRRRVPPRRRRASARRSAGKCAVPTPDETRPAPPRNPGPRRTDTTATRTAPYEDPWDRT
jgi:transposase